MKKFAGIWMVLLVLGLGSARGNVFEELGGPKLIDELHKHSGSFPEIHVATNREALANFSWVPLNAKPMMCDKTRYDGFRFKTPATPGTFYWAFNLPNIPRQVAGWYVCPADDGEFVELGENEHVTTINNTLQVEHRLPPGRLKPGTTYLACFAFNDAQPFEMAVTAGVFSGPRLMRLDCLHVLPPNRSRPASVERTPEKP